MNREEMWRAALLAFLSFVPFLNLSAEENKANSNVLETVDYRQKFKNVASKPFVVEAVNVDFGNPYIVAVMVAIGTHTFYVDDINKPTTGVMEVSFLGNEVAMRVALSYAPRGWQMEQLQLLIDKKWVNCQPEPEQLRFQLLDLKKLLRKGKMEGVLLSIPSLDDGRLLQLEIRNKN